MCVEIPEILRTSYVIIRLALKRELRKEIASLLSMGRRHGNKEHSCLVGIHVPLNPLQHALQSHPVSILRRDLENVLHFIVERTPPVGPGGNQKKQTNKHQRRYNFKWEDVIYLEKLQDLHLQASHPPEIRIEHHDIDPSPLLPVLVDRSFPHYPVGYPVDNGII